MEPFEHFQADTTPEKKNAEPEYKSHLAQSHSFASDLAQAVRQKGGAVVRSAISENEKHVKEYEDRVSANQRKYLIMSFVILALTSGIIWYLYTYKQAHKVVLVEEVPPPPSIILSEDSTTIDMSEMQFSDLLNAINRASSDTKIREGTIRNIIITRAVNGVQSRIPATQLLASIGAHTPVDLTRALTKEFMLGVSVYNGAHRFLVLRGTAHDYLLQGLLAWEPYMLEDLGGLLDNNDAVYLYQNAHFTEALVANRDTRAILDVNKNPVLFYSFIDANTVLISASPKAFSESIRRL